MARHGFGKGDSCVVPRTVPRRRPDTPDAAAADGVAFAVHNRPMRGSKGHYRVNLRHGVSRVRSGMRHTVGIIFHDAT
jgi:hypothetical protein